VHYIAQICLNQPTVIINYKQKSNIMHHQNIIETLKKRRISLSVNQETLALLSDVGLRTLKQIESGRGNPTLETIQKLADVLGLQLKLEIKKLESEDEEGNDFV
jgi:transcriptional regulator with XRE-family HTH domain